MTRAVLNHKESTLYKSKREFKFRHRQVFSIQLVKSLPIFCRAKLANDDGERSGHRSGRNHLCRGQLLYKSTGIDLTIQSCSSLCYVKGTVHEKPFFSGKGGLGHSKYESGKKIRIKIKQGAEKWRAS